MTPLSKILKTFLWFFVVSFSITTIILWAIRSTDEHLYGYTPNPDAVAEFLAELDEPLFADAGQEAILQAKQADTFLYRSLNRAYLARYGKEFVVGRQGIGDCVAWAWCHGLHISQSIDWELGKIPDAPLEPCVESVYGGSRVEARNKPEGSGGYRDGSFGAAAARWVKDWGVVYRDKILNHDLVSYDKNRCKRWGNFGNGGEGDEHRLDAVAKNHPATYVALVKTWDECAAALESGFPVVVCSSYGFSSKRDEEGFAIPDGKRSGTWMHAMVLCGIRYKKNGSPRDAALCLNSWGPRWNSGGKWPSDQPDGSFWIEKNTVAGMLSGKDSFAVGSIDGFPFRDLDHGAWTAPPPNE